MYLKFSEKTITDFSEKNINTLYNQGYVFTRVGRGLMNQTRSLRIDLSKFELTSENRRVLKKTEEIKLEIARLPYHDYTWQIGKMAKDFYDTKFGDKTFSANKIKELLTDERKSNFNLLLTFNCHPELDSGSIGYTICNATNAILHYCYPFYDLEKSPKDTGLGMMIRAIVWAKENGKKYIYLGSASRPNDTYKLQFKGVEWFDENKWSEDLEKLKNILK
jgi:arginyl-tRNA--protein-N-Asp/Glu arginylyltransferase